MKRTLLFVLALIASGCGPEGPPPDGPFETYYDNGQLMVKETYKDGVQDGPYEDYHENGQLWSKGTFKDGEWDGPYESYHENGQLWLRGTYKDGERCGEWLWFEGETVTNDPCPPDLADGN